MPNDDARINTATLTLYGVAYTGTADVLFDANSDVNEIHPSATLTDSYDGAGPWPAFNDSDSVEYMRDLTCPAWADDAYEDGVSPKSTVQNTATLSSNGHPLGESRADVDLTCYRLGLEKDAQTAFTRTFDWDIHKIAEPAELTLNHGETGTISYTIFVTKTGFTDSGWSVGGTIDIHNPAPMIATVSLTDVLPGFDVALDTCIEPFDIAPGDTASCEYSATPEAPIIAPLAATNTATATLSLQNGGTRAYSDSADVNFSDPTTLVREQVHVEDENDLHDGALTFGPFGNTGQVEYTEPFTCLSAPYQYIDNVFSDTFINKATIRELQDKYAEASVDITCVRPDLTIEKTANADAVNAGETITFTITVRNNGTGVAENVVVTDTLPTHGELNWDLVDDLGQQCAIENGVLRCGFGDLAGNTARTIQLTSPTTVATCGVINNMAEVSSDNTPGGSDSASVTVLCSSITVVKETIGGQGTFNFTGALGEFPLNTEVQGQESRTFDNLAPGSYTIAETVPAGWGLQGIVCIDGQNETGATSGNAVTVNLTGGADVTCTFTNAVANNQIDKSPDLQIVKRGQDAEFTITVTNTGAITLTNVTVADPGYPQCSHGPIAELAPNASFSYDCSVANVMAGFTNTATATGVPPAGPQVSDSDTAQVNIASIAILKLTNGEDAKTPTGPIIPAGGDVTWTYLVTNTGEVELTNVIVTDDKGVTVSCPNTILPPNDSMTCTGAGAATAGQYDNTGTVTGRYGDGPDDTVSASDPSHYFGQIAGITLDKTALEQGYGAVGDVIDYTLVATNTGNVVLTDVTISDPLLGDLVCDLSDPVTLQPNETLTCEGSYQVTQADLNSGSVPNTATVVGTPPVGEPVQDTDDELVTGSQTPAIHLDKAYAGFQDLDGNSVLSLGDLVTYAFTITNVGNVTLNPVTLTDEKLGLENVICGLTSLDAGQFTTCEHTYPVSQADVNAGSIFNTAIAIGQPPTGEPVDDDDEATVPIAQSATLALDKTALQASYGAVGEVINYTLVATNNGNVVLTNVTISDPLLGNLVCDPAQGATLQPGEAIACEGSYTVDQDDLNAGNVSNTATAIGQSPTGAPVQDTDDANVSGAQGPTIALDKAFAGFQDLDDSGDVTLNDVITYAFTITNVGNVMLNPVTLTDAKLGLENVTCGLASLNPGQFTTCEHTYTVTQSDVDAEAILNTATAIGQPPIGDPVQSTDQVTTPVTAPAAGAELATIGDFVWHDLNGNGVQDEGEPGMPGVTVWLYQAGQSEPVDQTETDGNGEYFFVVPAGQYYVAFELPTGYSFTVPNAGDDPSRNSKVIAPSLTVNVDSEVEAGQPLAYTVTYANTGSRPAQGMSLTFTVPANTTFSPGDSGWVCEGEGTVAQPGTICTLSIGDLNAGANGLAAIHLLVDEDAVDAIALTVNIWQTTSGQTAPIVLGEGGVNLDQDAGLVPQQPASGGGTSVDVQPPTSLPAEEQPDTLAPLTPSLFIPTLSAAN